MVVGDFPIETDTIEESEQVLADTLQQFVQLN